MTAPVDAEQVKSQFRTIARQGVQACELLERGQAETPLGDFFRGIADSAASGPFSVIVLGTSIEARSTALAWICGADHRVFAIHVPKEVGLVEVHLQSQGFVLEKADGGRQEFDRLEPFLEAVKSADLVRSGDGASWVNPLCLRVAAPPGVQGLTILMPENLDALLASPTMLRRLVAASNVLLIAGPAAWTPTDGERGTIAELTGMLDVARPLLLPSEGEAPRRGWWSDRALLAARHLLPPLALDPAQMPALPPLLTDARDPMRQALFLSGVSRRLQSAVDMVAARIQDEQHQLQTKHTASGRRLKTIEDAARKEDPRSAYESVRDELTEDLGRLLDGLRESNRKALLATGPSLEQVRQALKELGAGDLRQEPGFSTIKLTVDPKFLERASAILKQVSRAVLRDDMVLMRDGLSLAREKLAQKLSQLRGAPVSADLAIPDEREIWDAVAALISVEIRYQGEMPKRGFWKRLGEGRRIVFVILMFASLFGGMVGFNRRAPWVATAMLVLFAGGFVWTFHTWKHEDAERLEKELDRVREALEAEARRLLAEAEREKMTRLQAHVERLRKEVYRVVDDCARDGARSRADTLDREREELRSSMRNMDQRVREYQSHAQRVSQLRQSCSELDGAVRDCLTGLVRAAQT